MDDDHPQPSGRFTEERVQGCMLGGALGDALGAPVEFMSWEQIQWSYDEAGISELPADAAFTDDTQMTLFTAEGLIRASVRSRSRGVCHPPSVVWHAYLRWLHTQGYPWSTVGAPFASGAGDPDGWLVHERLLHRQMAPGNTCLSALESGQMGSPRTPLNDSKGCGAVMRAAPIGMITADAGEAFELGCEVGAITHGHRDGYEAAGALAVIIFGIARQNLSVGDAVSAATLLLSESGGVLRLLEAALQSAEGPELTPSEISSRFGGGWVGDEALGLGVYCALKAEDFTSGVRRAVNHSGDSDSTGSIAGNLLGAALGADELPREWLARLGGVEIVSRLALDLWTEASDPPADEWGAATPGWFADYPGW